ncbi:MAG TPA: PilZ domain-containing protein [Desulfomonilaceae bacterium]|nr:PilZ domain-containing protein [Desulfomonilaceae bacterium]
MAGKIDISKSQIAQMRSSPRSYPIVMLPIFDVDDPTIEGLIQDISETGVQVSGMKIKPDAKKTFIIQPENFSGIKPFSFDAECRWVRPQTEDQPCMSGFEIIGISEKDKEELKKVLQILAFSDSGPM